MKKNTTAVLIDRYGMTVEEIAVAVKASASAVRTWKQGQTPRPVYRALLTDVLKEKSELGASK